MTETPPHSLGKRPDGSVIIRPWPKVIFFYPTWIVATLLWLIALFTGDGESARAAGDAAAQNAEAQSAAAQNATAEPGSFWTRHNIFLVIFFVNLLVFSFDFSRIKSITIVLALIAALLGLAWLNNHFEIGASITDALAKVDARMNSWFYGSLSVFFALVFLIVLINTRFNYYEVNYREILHHHGYLGDVTRSPTSGLQLHKEIYDLMEYLLLRSGRLVFHTTTSRQPIIIDNVIAVNKVEEHVKNLLSVVAVRMQEDRSQPTEHGF